LFFLAGDINTGRIVAESNSFEFEYPGTINPRDIPRMGISNLTKIEQLLDALPDEQMNLPAAERRGIRPHCE
jgi:hypothetical protein